MEIFEVTRERLMLDSGSLKKILVVFLIVLPASIVVLMMHQNLSSGLIGGFGVKFLGGKVQNVTTADAGNHSLPTISPNEERHGGLLGPEKGHEVASKNISSESTVLTDGKHLPGSGFGNESSSENDSSNSTSITDDRLNSTHSSPGNGTGSGSTGESSSMPDHKLGNKTSSIGSNGESGEGSSQLAAMSKDKLLDGLLVPGFDEATCLSRYQSFLYRRSSQHKPSSFLLSKLRKYEDLHKRCGPYSKHYKTALKRLKSGQSSGSGKGCKYVAWIPANGLGNRMISMVSTFLYAILTERVMLVHNKRDMADVFCEPFPNTSWALQTTHFPLRSFDSVEFRHRHGYGNLLKKANGNVANISVPYYLYLNLDYGQFDIDRRSFYCDQAQAFLGKVPWLFLISDQYFLPSFFLIPSFKEVVSRMFPDKDTIFHHLGRYLFHPSNNAWGLITRFYEAYLAKADERIGLQIRIRSPETTSFEIITEQILSCSLKEKLLPQVDTQNPIASPSTNRTSKAVMIASLYPNFYENISNMYLAMPTVSGEVIGVYQPSHEHYQHFGDSKHNIKAFVDMYLLSLSDVLVTSAWSTFGYVAQGLGALKPWILYMRGHWVPDPACIRDISCEPCFHYPPNYTDCETQTTIDVGAVYPYLRHCKDLKRGIKLASAKGDRQ